jgi:anti-sigma factor RsiW
MKCSSVRANLVLYIYDEMTASSRSKLKKHLVSCSRCAAETKSARRFQAQVSQLRVREPTADLLAACRIRLRHALAALEHGRIGSAE